MLCCFDSCTSFDYFFFNSGRMFSVGGFSQDSKEVAVNLNKMLPVTQGPSRYPTYKPPGKKGPFQQVKPGQFVRIKALMLQIMFF